MALLLCAVPLPATAISSESAESALPGTAPIATTGAPARGDAGPATEEPSLAERGSLNDWSPLVVRYLVLSVVCGAAFTLVFVKCWRDASAHAASLAEAAEAAEQSGDTSGNAAAS